VINMTDTFDQCSIGRMAEHNDITHERRAKKEGDFGCKNKIPFSVLWKQTVANNSKQPAHL
jgi:hypothetical protein